MKKTEDEIIQDAQEKKWCVYMHTNKIDNKKYIGITCQNPPNRRWSNGYGYRQHPHFWRAIQKYGWDNFDHILVLQNETYEYACKAEKCLIKHYKTKDPKHGYNMTDGGEGTFGYSLSEESKQKISQKNTGKPSHMKGKHHTDETKQKLSIAHKGKMTGELNPMYGISPQERMDEETFKKWKENVKNNIPRGENHPFHGLKFKEIFKNEDDYEKWYNNHRKYWDSIKGKSKSEETRKKMSESQRKRRCKEDNVKTNKHQKNEIKVKKKKDVHNSHNCIPIYCIELNRIFWGAKEAQQNFNISSATIAACCKHNQKNKTAGKHPETGEKLHWLYAEEAIDLGHITKENLDKYLNSLG